ncbi:MAG: hypothetical protein CMB32_06255 [Euryarchaeota archaeon]|nr:hypothetical protein [Euryarchaeota archaeon]|tara:strand:+ start:402 stop:1955 length:1554 start_codon:yes stop_codon:yes gene_type:complete
MIRFSLAVFSFLFTTVAIAQTQVVWPASTIDVYQSGALVEHSDSVKFSGEKLELTVGGIATSLNRSSIQVDLPNGIVLESLNYKRIDSENPNKHNINSLSDSISLLKFQKQMYEALLHTLNEERAFLKANRKIGSDQEVLLVDDLIEMADFLRERNQDLGLEILDVELDIETAASKIAELESRKSSLINEGVGKEGEIHLVLTNVSMNSKTEFVTVRYMTSKAGWTPQYSLYYEEGEVFVKRQAQVQQKSGIDWLGVEVELLSGRPAESLMPNQFEDWVIEQDAPSYVRTEVMYGAVEEDEEIEFENSVSYAGDTKYSFELEGLVNLKSSRQSQKFEIGSFLLEGEVEYYAAPAINTSAYAMVRCSDWSDKQLMPGKANVVSSNSYLGWYQLNIPVVGDTLDVNLGNDPHVLCSRQLSAESSLSKRFGGKNEVIQTWKLAIENTHSDSIKVNLADKLPRVKNRNSDISITATSNDGGVVDSANHEIAFNIELAPLERKVVTYVLTVSYPSSMSLKNL